MIILTLIFLLSILAIAHSYILYPFILSLLGKKYSQNNNVFDTNDPELPNVTIIFAAHNEEAVINQKIISTFETEYPIHKIQLIVGTDNCTDNTDNIIASHLHKYNILHFSFTQRQGKAKILNYCVSQNKNEIIILTDANVFFDKETIYQLVKHYKNPTIGLVGGNILNPSHKETKGIFSQEKYYLYNETKTKYLEGIIWGSMIGSFGGCYSIRKELYTVIPTDRLLSDDFLITINVIKNNFKAINETKAIAYEDLNESIKEEFRRKKRIALGTMPIILQNTSIWLLPTSGFAFALLSHKVLRYLTPPLLIIALISNLIIYQSNIIFQITLYCQILFYASPIIDAIASSIKINIPPLRFISHFIIMNIALLAGSIKSLATKQYSNWTPSKRN